MRAILLLVTILATACCWNLNAQTAIEIPRNHDVPDLPVTNQEDEEEIDSIKASLEILKGFPDSISVGREPVPYPSEIESEEFSTAGDTLHVLARDTLKVINTVPDWIEREVQFVPDPKKAVWLSALFPGLGQIYNRRYWKLPILVGGYLGLAYATSWNSGMLKDYTRAYSDIMDNDPSTHSYMDFFPPNVREEQLDKTWLTNLLKTRKDYFRRNRDLCIISIVGVYLVAMVDAYVDASLAHFDITPDLTLDWAPAIFQDGRNQYPSVGLQWALNF